VKESPSQAKINLNIFLYMACSSTMLIINKVTIYVFPAPISLLLIQLSLSALAIFILGRLRFFTVDPLKWSLVQDYYGVVIVFVMNIFTNIKALQYSNVETVIVFRTCTSLAVAFGDYKFLGRGLPTPPVFLSLSSIALGALIYVISDSTFKITSYLWVTAYFVCQCIDVLYIKFIVDKVPMTSWGRSFYNNLLALPPLMIAFFLTNEIFYLSELLATYGVKSSNLALIFGMILLSSIVGLLLSICGFICRECVSATSFSVVGNMNKVLTVLINLVIWDKHATPYGLIGLGASLVSGALYTKFVTEQQKKQEQRVLSQS